MVDEIKPGETGFQPTAGAASRIDDRSIPPIADDRGPRRRRLFRRSAVYAFVAVAVLAGTGAVWFYGSRSGLWSDGGSPPLVQASSSPIKERPEQPGGMAVPDRDKEVYSTLRGAPPMQDRDETLMPPPEQPVMPPEPSGAGSAGVAGSIDLSRPEPSAAAEPPGPTPPMPESIAELPRSDESAVAPSLPPGEVRAPSLPSEPETALATPPATSADSAGSGRMARVAPGPEIPGRYTYRIQLGALRTASTARERWGKLRTAHPDLLGDLVPRFERADLGSRGIYYRLQVGPFMAKALAVSRCDELKKRNLGCFIVRER